ncbi:MAG: GNAT family N-acetyltransferase [Synechococcaceae cyanobacterium]|nr:GNAT family N-acetyltransferase [Synechococcaceae cyanobacterium]
MVIRHGSGALRLRLWPGALTQLRRLLDQHSFWGQGRSAPQLRRMLAASQAAVSLWDGRRLVGFGRASSDRVFRAVLWDVVVAESHRSQGLGRRVVEELLRCPAVRAVERVYLMTTNGEGFYRHLGFDASHRQHLLVWHPSRQRDLAGRESAASASSFSPMDSEPPRS